MNELIRDIKKILIEQNNIDIISMFDNIEKKSQKLKKTPIN